jgi:hypothetical protein
MAKRGHGEGSIEQRGDLIRLRYRLNGKKQSKTMPPEQGSRQPVVTGHWHLGGGLPARTKCWGQRTLCPQIGPRTNPCSHCVR